MKRIFFMFTFLFGVMAFSQEAALTIGQFLDQIIQDAFSLKGETDKFAMVVGGLALVVRALLSTVKVSILRPLIWDKLNDKQKSFAPLLLSFLLSLLVIKPLTISSVIVACISGSAAIPLHHLMQAVEGLPGVNKTVIMAIGFAQKYLGGKK